MLTSNVVRLPQTGSDKSCEVRMNSFQRLFAEWGCVEKTERAKDILTHFWTKGQGEPQKHQKELLSVVGLPGRVTKAEEAFGECYAKYDLLTNGPRLIDDPFWKTVDKGIEHIEQTGNCFFCGGKLKYRPLVESSLCLGDCGRMYFIKPLNCKSEKDESVSAQTMLESRWNKVAGN